MNEKFVYTLSQQSPEEIRAIFESLLKKRGWEMSQIGFVSPKVIKDIPTTATFEEIIEFLQERLPRVIETNVKILWITLLSQEFFNQPFVLFSNGGPFLLKPLESQVFWISLPIEASFRELIDDLSRIHQLNERKADQKKSEQYWARTMDKVAPMGKKSLPWKYDLQMIYKFLRSKSPHLKFGENDAYSLPEIEK